MSYKVKVELLRTAVGIVIALGILSLIIFLVSDTPLYALQTFFFGPFTSLRNFSTVIERFIPLMFTGLALALIFSSNNFNLAAEGAFYIGGLIAVMLSFTSDFNPFIYWVILITISGFVGGIIVVIPGFLKEKAGANEIVSSLMINEILFLIGSYILINYFVPEGSKTVASAPFPEIFKLPILIEGSVIHLGLVFAVVAYVVIYVLMAKTRFGHKVQLTGKNKSFAKVVGIKIGIVGLISQYIGGILAGIGGAVHTMGVFRMFTSDKLPGYGWDGIIVGTLARNNPLFVPLSAFFVAYLKAGAAIMARRTDVSVEIITIIQAIIIMLIIAKRLIAKLEFKMMLKEIEKHEKGVTNG